MPEMKFARMDFNADPNIGLYGWSTDSYCFLGFGPAKKARQKIEKILKVKVLSSTVAGTELSGIFAAGNSSGIVLTKLIEKNELAGLKKLFKGLNLIAIPSKETAIGNMVLCNDKAAFISSRLKRYRKKIEDCLGCETEAGTLGGMEIVGSAAIATNRGCLCHPGTSEEELKSLEELLKVRVDVGTMSFGSPFVKAGLIVNTKGMLTSTMSTGPELGRAFEVFGED